MATLLYLYYYFVYFICIIIYEYSKIMRLFSIILVYFGQVSKVYLDIWYVLELLCIDWKKQHSKMKINFVTLYVLCVQILIAHLPKIHQNNRKYNNNNTIPPPRLEGKDDFWYRYSQAHSQTARIINETFFLLLTINSYN